jgi:hypothetical protein
MKGRLRLTRVGLGFCAALAVLLAVGHWLATPRYPRVVRSPNGNIVLGVSRSHYVEFLAKPEQIREADQAPASFSR